MIANGTQTLLLFNEVNEQRLRHRKLVSEPLLSISPFNAKILRIVCYHPRILLFHRSSKQMRARKISFAKAFLNLTLTVVSNKSLLLIFVSLSHAVNRMFYVQFLVLKYIENVYILSQKQIFIWFGTINIFYLLQA